MRQLCHVIIWILVWSFSIVINASDLPLQLASVYRHQQPVEAYLVSEKYDGVRAYWDGSTLWTRGGHEIHAPFWFIQKFPTQSLDGELWIDYGKFDEVSAAVRRLEPDDEVWRKVSYLIFDLPELALPFEQRYQHLKTLIPSLYVAHLKVIEQRAVPSESLLERWLQEVILRGGEGLILHRKNAFHQSGRSDAVLKFKPFGDAEATVIEYQTGKGKFRDMVGALVVQNEDGLIFKLGSGLTIAERMNPPPIGSTVTYRFQGRTKTGKPRFARFLRLRDAL
ncbi:DNA ligase (ATP) [Pseudoalteromonas luteoviolacea B = ATCC 29581]|nr:DNA ligase (ATP) [Pseudoalteromonas luteoviolacea B = ATCC 29581]